MLRTARVDCVAIHCPALAAKACSTLLSFLTGLGLNRDDTDEGTLLLRSSEPQTAKRFERSSQKFGFLLARLGNDPPVYHKPLRRAGPSDLAECESALRQYFHREYLLAAVERSPTYYSNCCCSRCTVHYFVGFMGQSHGLPDRREGPARGNKRRAARTRPSRREMGRFLQVE